jgi:hypothetical protein
MLYLIEWTRARGWSEQWDLILGCYNVADFRDLMSPNPIPSIADRHVGSAVEEAANLVPVAAILVVFEHQ